MKMRKVLMLFSLGAIALTIATPTTAQACRNYVIEDGYVNVRTGPSTKYPIIGRAYEGSEVDIVDSSDGWLRISYPRNGWVSGKMIGTDCSGASATTGSRYPYTDNISVTNGNTLINIRQTPTWANLTKQERKSAREDIWWEYSSEYNEMPLTVNFYTSKGYHIAQYSSRCQGRCFTRE